MPDSSENGQPSGDLGAEERGAGKLRAAAAAGPITGPAAAAKPSPDPAAGATSSGATSSGATSSGATSSGATSSGVTSSEATLYDQPWLHSFFRPFLTGLMGAALAIAFLAFLARFVPDLPPIYTQGLVVVSLVAALVACYTTTWLAQPAQRARRNIGFRTAELGLLLVAVRLVSWLGMGSWPTLDLLLLRPLDALIDGAFIGGALVVGVAWFMASALTADQLALALQPDDLYMAQEFTDRWQDTSRPLYTDRAAIMQRFVGRWVLGGVLLVVLAAGARLDVPQVGFLGIARQGIDPVVIGAIIAYFLSGLILVSQGQLALLRSRWTLEKIPNAQGIMRNWGVYAGALILFMGLLALLLPLGGTFWAAVIVGSVLQAVYFFVLGVFQTILAVFLFILSLLTGEAPPEQPTPQETPAPMMPQEPPPAAAGLPPWVGGMVFWVIIALILGYATYIYFSERGIQWAWLRRFLHALRARWQEIFGAYQTWQATRLRARAARARDGGGGGLGGLPAWLRLRNLTPTQQVRYYYLSTLHRAEQAGLPRRPAETPIRYAPRLARFIEENNLEHPDEAQDVEELTEAFLRVRYADVSVDEEELPLLKRVWERLRRYLRL